MIPDLIDLGSPTPWPVLPPGIHDTTMDEIAQRFATTPHRRRLLAGFERAAHSLEAAGCLAVYLNGSLVTGKPHPGDFDGCWETAGVNKALLDPILLRFERRRELQKLKYGGELFFADAIGAPGLTFLQLFQRETYSGRPKGILRLRLPLKGNSP